MKAISENLSERGKRGMKYCRRRIPTALLDAYPRQKTHITVSLGTSNLGQAKELLKAENIRIDAEFARVAEELKRRRDERSIERVKKMSDEQLKSLADYWVHQVLATDEFVRSQGLDDEDFDEIGSSLQSQRAELGRMLATGRSEKILPAMRGFFYLCGLQFDLPPEETKRVASVFLGAVISAMDYRMQRQTVALCIRMQLLHLFRLPKRWQRRHLPRLSRDQLGSSFLVSGATMCQGAIKVPPLPRRPRGWNSTPGDVKGNSRSDRRYAGIDAGIC